MHVTVVALLPQVPWGDIDNHGVEGRVHDSVATANEREHRREKYKSSRKQLVEVALAAMCCQHWDVQGLKK